MSSNVNWMGNRVLDQNSARQMTPPQTSAVPAQAPVVPAIPMQQSTPLTPITQQGPPPSTEKGYIPYYLASNIGKNVRAEFIIGTTQYADKTGMLTEVGINYFVLRDVNSHTDIMCDLYSVKFVTLLL
ncbi:MAG: hypothetical protein VB064_02735 [Oscillospiraceae bacterium]|nr:hypothetical protein [Oscillospiraceae bacterium]